MRGNGQVDCAEDVFRRGSIGRCIWDEYSGQSRPAGNPSTVRRDHLTIAPAPRDTPHRRLSCHTFDAL